MQGTYQLSDLAQEDLDEIWDFLYRKTKSVDVADNFIDYIFSLIELIASRPNIGVPKDHIIEGLKRFPFPHHRYYVYYTPQIDNIYIERIVSAYREQGELIFE